MVQITDPKTKDIHSQVCLKIASEQVKGSPKQLTEYAKELQKEFFKEEW